MSQLVIDALRALGVNPLKPTADELQAAMLIVASITEDEDF